MKKPIIQGFILGSICFLSRIVFLTRLPIFTDEAIYIYWAQHIVTTHHDLFISLYDGKPPIFIWLISASLLVFPPDWYLFAGRLVSVLSSVGTVVAIFAICRLLFKEKNVAWLASGLYIITPFSFVYDRLALFDSLFTTMLVWATYYMFRTAKTLSVKDALGWGVFLGLGFLVKPPALLFLILTPIGFLILSRKKLWLVLPVVLISLAMNSLVRISGNYQAMVAKNAQFQLTPSEFFHHPFEIFFKNIISFGIWLNTYYTFPIFLMGIVGLIVLFRYHKDLAKVFLLLWGGSLVLFALVGKVVFPRYIVFLTPYFLIPLAYTISEFTNQFQGLKRRHLGTLSILLLPALLSIFSFARFPFEAKIPKEDYEQFISSYTSGYGLDPVIDYLEREAKDNPIVVVSEGTFGLFPYAFELHFKNNPNVHIMSREKIEFIDPELYALKEKHTFFVFQKYQYIPGQLLLKELVRGEKPGGKSFPIILGTFL